MVLCTCWLWLAPGTRNIDNSTPDVPLRGGNNCPFVLGSEFIRTFLSEYGYVYNPEYIFCGGLEDWDAARRMSKLGFGFGICSLVDVWHKGMGTRSMYDSNNEQVFNRNLYNNIWGGCVQPGFEIDFKTISEDLKPKFEKKFNKFWYK